MSDDHKRVRPGDPLRITARVWNKVVGGVATRPGFEFEPVPQARTNFVIRCKNQSGAPVPRWGVLAITGVAVEPTVDPTGAATQSFESQPAVIGVAAATGTQGQYVVAVQPIAAGEFGFAAVDGVVQVKLDIVSATHRFATPKAGSTEMQTAASGEATILWKQAGTGTGKWGLVRIGTGAGATIKWGKITGSALPSTSRTVYEWVPGGSPYQVTGSTYECLSQLGPVYASPTAPRWVVFTQAGTGYQIIAAEC